MGKPQLLVLLHDGIWLWLRGGLHTLERGRHLRSPVPTKPAAPMDGIWPLNYLSFQPLPSECYSQQRRLSQKGAWRTPKYSISNFLLYFCWTPVLILVSAVAKGAASWIEGTSSLAHIHPLNYPSSERPGDESTATKSRFGPRIFSILHLKGQLEALTQKGNHRILHSSE